MSLNPLTGLLIWDQRAVLVVAKLLPRVHRNKWHKSKAVIPVDSWRRRYTHNVVESVSPRVHQYCLVQAGRKIMAIGETGSSVPGCVPYCGSGRGLKRLVSKISQKPVASLSPAITCRF